MANILPRSLRAVGSGLRTGWLILGILLLLIVVGEVGLRLALTAKDRLVRQSRTEHRIDQPAQVSAYHEEELDATKRYVWQPYVYWRHPPYQGRHVEVDRNGLRATWNPPSRDTAAAPTPVRVFAFGASTLWGSGARDDYTIASHLSKLLHERGYRAEVTNYGQLGYVSTQSAIVLLRCLHRGEIPDIALFYDGVNDLIASHTHDAAGVSVNEWLRRAEFDLPNRPHRLLRYSGRQFPAKGLWGFGRLAAGLRRRLRSAPDDRSRTQPLSDELARRTLHVYTANLAFIESLGQPYGFEPLFYWQPNIFSKRRRSPREQVAAERLLLSEKVYEDMYRRVRRSAALNGQPRFHDISGLFDDVEEPYYVDMWHLSESGNQLVAAAMVDDVIALIERRRSAVE